MLRSLSSKTPRQSRCWSFFFNALSYVLFYPFICLFIHQLFIKSPLNASYKVEEFSSVQFSCSVVSDSATTWTVAHQVPLSMEFSRQEYWSGLPFPFPGDLPNPGIEPWSPDLQTDSLPSEPLRNPHYLNINLNSDLRSSNIDVIKIALTW